MLVGAAGSVVLQDTRRRLKLRSKAPKENPAFKTKVRLFISFSVAKCTPKMNLSE
jgi:hypothetical protein